MITTAAQSNPTDPAVSSSSSSLINANTQSATTNPYTFITRCPACHQGTPLPRKDANALPIQFSLLTHIHRVNSKIFIPCDVCPPSDSSSPAHPSTPAERHVKNGSGSSPYHLSTSANNRDNPSSAASSPSVHDERVQKNEEHIPILALRPTVVVVHNNSNNDYK